MEPRHYMHDGLQRGIELFNQGEFFEWTGTHYPVVEDQAVRAELYRFLEKAKRLQRVGNAWLQGEEIIAQWLGEARGLSREAQAEMEASPE